MSNIQTRRYHLRTAQGRTTVSIPAVLADLLALKLGTEPGTAVAHGAVRSWLQERTDFLSDNDFPSPVNLSACLAGRVLQKISERPLPARDAEGLLSASRLRNELCRSLAPTLFEKFASLDR